METQTIKVYAQQSGPVSKAILQVIALFEEVSGSQAIEEADVVLVTEREQLNALWRADKLFGFVLTQPDRIPTGLPENVFVISAITLFKSETGLIAFIDWVKARLQMMPKSTPVEAVSNEQSDMTIISSFRRKYSVLVLDNDANNQRLAHKYLKDHFLTVHSRLQDAVGELEKGRFDAVLTDMQMPLDLQYGALSADAINPSLEVPYGFAMIFEATMRCMPVAVVTDGNHHRDWVSAMFDRITGATVNGQKVLFLNGIGKRWDQALKHLMEE